MNAIAKPVLGSLDGRRLIIGREGHVYIGDPSVSKQHAEIIISGGKIRLRDLNSTNGTYLVNRDKQIPLKDAYVEPHQTIVFGGHRQQVQNLLDIVYSISFHMN